MAAERPLIVSIVGTRPEAIKMLPVAQALAACPALDQRIILTGQHKGLAPLFGEMPVRELAFNPAGRSAVRLREGLHGALCGRLKRGRADLVLVHGDTASAVAGAFAARDCAIPVGHVEAGLRSFNYREPWPEEGNRVVIDALSQLLFAPTDAAVRNLQRDFRVKGAVYLTGNTGIDALFDARDRIRPAPATADASPRRTLLVTCHRKENHGEKLAAIASALKRLVSELPVRILLPLHLNPQLRRQVTELLGGVDQISLIEPQEHAAMVRLITASWLVLTDSGGLQEEAPALGKPVLVLRNVTERAEAGENIELVGSDPERIFGSVSRLLVEPERYRRMARPNLAFGDGRAAPRIVRAVAAYLRSRRPRLHART